MMYRRRLLRSFARKIDKETIRREYKYSWDKQILRQNPDLNVDLWTLNPHPRDKYNEDFRKLHTEVIYLKAKQEQKMEDLARGIDDRDVMVDLETFRFRDVFIKHFKNLGQPVDQNDYFIITSAYFIAGYLIWIFFKWLGRKIREPHLRKKMSMLSQEEREVNRRRTDEDKLNADLVLNSKAPQYHSRYDYEEGEETISSYTKELVQHIRESSLDVNSTILNKLSANNN
jgi:hypothetical protein